MEPEIVDWLGDGPESREAVDTPGVSRIHDPRPPLLGVVAAPEVRADATVRVRSIATAFNTLNSIVRRHERTIQKRWGKKTRQQRVKILIAAWPNMARGHRPEFQAYLEERTLQNFEYREHYIWPYINQEDLGGPRPLLILLNARARHPPSMFAGADLGAMHIGILLGAITPVTLKDEDYAMVLHGVTRSVDYGRLQALKTPIDYSKWVKSGKQFLPGHGLLVLEAQERLMAFFYISASRSSMISHGIP